MIPIERLLADLRIPEPLVELERADPRLEEAAAAAFSGDYLRAAQIAEALYVERIFDARLLGYVLFETLNERGPAVLKLVLQTAARVLSEGRAAFTPMERRDVLLDGSINWLLEKLARQLERAEKFQEKEQSWQRWVNAASDGRLVGALPAAEALQTLLGTLNPRARGLMPLLRLLDLLHQLMQSAEPQSQRTADARASRNFSSARTLEAKLQEGSVTTEDEDHAADKDMAAGSEPQPDSASDIPVAEVAPGRGELKHSRDAEDSRYQDSAQDPSSALAADEDTAAEDGDAAPGQTGQQGPPRARYMRAPKPPLPLPAGFSTETSIVASLPLRKLARAIQRFASLVEQEEFVAAAVVADEIQSAIDRFDPRLYLPALLTPYFSTLASCSDDLEPILKDRQSLAFTALRQLYQVAPKSFDKGIPLPARLARLSMQDDAEAQDQEPDEDDSGDEDES